MIDVGVADKPAEPCPVFRLIICRHDVVREFVELADIFLQGCRTSDGEVGVVAVGTLGRREAFQPYARDSHVLVVIDSVDRCLYFPEFTHVVTIFGIDYGLVYREVYERRPFEGLNLGTGVFRLEIDNLRDSGVRLEIFSDRVETLRD